jgi:hypothetical protein
MGWRKATPKATPSSRLVYTLGASRLSYLERYGVVAVALLPDVPCQIRNLAHAIELFSEGFTLVSREALPLA